MATVLHETERAVGRTQPCNWLTPESVADVVREARTTVADVRDKTRDAAERLELTARRRPLATVGVAAAAGFVAGSVAAFAFGWFAGRRTRA